MPRTLLVLLLAGAGLAGPLHAQEGLVDACPLPENDLALARPARPGTCFDRAGHRFALLGDESGRFEAVTG